MKVLIADDHWMIRESFKHVISRIKQNLQLVEAATFDEALNSLNEHPDIELMFVDLVMPGLSEVDGLRTLRTRHPTVPLAIVSVHEDREDVLQAISEGVIGYIPKSVEAAEMVRALTTILNGGVYFPRDILQGSRVGVSTRSTQEDVNGSLTARECQVLSLISKGASNAEIAETLGMSPNTVRVHVRNLGMKLNLRERSELAAYGLAHVPNELI